MFINSKTYEDLANLSTAWLCPLCGVANFTDSLTDQGPVVQKPINANLRLKINKGVLFSSPKCCSRLIFGKTLYYKKSILKNKNNHRKLSPKR